MAVANLGTVLRPVADSITVIDVQGEINAFAEGALMDAYTRATEAGAKVIIFNFAGLTFMNSAGIGLLVTLLIRAQRQGQRVLAFGMNAHYRQIFELTRLNEAVAIYASEAEAMAAAR